MKIIKKILSQLILLIITLLILFAIILLPKEANIERTKDGEFKKAEYIYSFDKHFEEMKGFIKYIATTPNLGMYSYDVTNAELIIQKMKKSLCVIIPALLIAFFGGIAKGIFDYWTKDKKRRLIGKGSTWLFLSVPDLFVIISIQLTIMALHEWGLTPHISVYGYDSIDIYIICSIFLLIYPLFYVANVTYLSIQDEEGNDYIRTAKAKGLHSFKILYTHVLKNSIPNILSQTNTITLYVLSNLLIIEKLTDFRGTAYYFYESIGRENFYLSGQEAFSYPVSSVGFVFCFTIIIFIANTISNICKTLVTPVSKYEISL
ncbi:ABC transporter permease subunit [Heyndrickxia sp. FSL W8-0496]|uniref:ABC transporter permease subunit n=1 Tax=Heyndrickxia TaxID=2837504 RepID=UPI0030F93863